MTWSRGTAYGLSTPIDDWWSRGACSKEDPNLWFAERHRREALHICRRHCPVLAQCHADALRRPPSFAVQGGEAWSGSGGLLYGGAVQPSKSCRRCPPKEPPPKPPPAQAPPPAVRRRRRYRVPASPELGLAGLSAAELRVARLMCDTELTGRQIAAELHVSLNTIKTHVRQIYRKVGVRCPADLRASPLLKEAIS